MVTQELIAYVRGELNKGKTREEIRTALLSGGGWNEEEVTEVFRTVIPAEVKPVSNVTFQAAIGQKEIKPLFSLNRDLKPMAPVTPVTPVTAVVPPTISPKSVTPVITPTPPPTVAPVTPRPVFTPAPTIQPIVVEKKESKYLYPAIAAILFGAILFAIFYFFRPEIASLNQRAMSALDSFASSIGGMFDGGEDVATPTQETPNVYGTPAAVTPVVKEKVNCGTTTSPDRKNAPVYSKDNVLKCIGESAATCNPAEAVLTDEVFPTQFKIVEANNGCRFELSYSSTSTLTDVNGKKLAGRTISCPVSVVRAIDESNSQKPVFVAANTTNPHKYAVDIHTYATLGVFIQNNFDQAKINALGCNGEFIASVIESYKMAQ